MTLPYMRSDLPKKFLSFRDGDAAFACYQEKIEANILFHFIFLGVEIK